MKRLIACLLMLVCIAAEASYPCPNGATSCPWFTVWGYTGDYQAVGYQPYTDFIDAYPGTTNSQTMLSAMPSNMKVLGFAFDTGTCASGSWPNTPYISDANFASANVAAFAAAGKYFRIITGGANYTFKCSTPSQMVSWVAQYNSPYMLGVDFDIEGGSGYGGNVTATLNGTTFTPSAAALFSPKMTSGGTSGYAVSDVLTFTGGTFNTAASITVTSVSSGVITGYTFSGGSYTSFPTGTLAYTGGSGTGAVFTSQDIGNNCVILSANAKPGTEITTVSGNIGQALTVNTTNNTSSGSYFISCATAYTQADVDNLVQGAMLAQAAYPQMRFTFNFGGYGGAAQYLAMGTYGIFAYNSVIKFGMQNYTFELQTGAGTIDANHCILYPDNSACEIGLTAIQEANNVHNWYGIPYNQIELNVANLGYQEVANNYMTLADICNIVFWAENYPLAGVSLWSFSRDRDCPAGTYSDTCNGWPYAGVLGFTKTFLKAFGY